MLTVFKLLAGVIAHSGAMISDAIHSASDVFSTIVVISAPTDDSASERWCQASASSAPESIRFAWIFVYW